MSPANGRKIIIEEEEEEEEEVLLFFSLYVLRPWCNGQRQGVGKYLLSDSVSVYEGDFVNDEQTGKGKLSTADGCNYSGRLNIIAPLLWKEGRRYKIVMVDTYTIIVRWISAWAV